MLEKKVFQSKIMNKINRLSLIIFILNWIFLSFLFSLAFLLISFINYGFYIFIINQINKQKAQEEFKKQFGDGDYSKEDIIKKHIQNLFESDLDINQIQRSEIKKQYRLMAKKYHPDVYTGTQKDKFTSINSSYKYLINLVK
ncbi:MAG: DnaJ domain-containing protein [Campylobacteraceae bacterium]|nr:DnaJ domain-containing protein [Campylobacteraceae bacterium]MBT4029947.1 DnaJ domain-containing protein [Campylobacteraceae bacterium]